MVGAAHTLEAEAEDLLLEVVEEGPGLKVTPPGPPHPAGPIPGPHTPDPPQAVPPTPVHPPVAAEGPGSPTIRGKGPLRILAPTAVQCLPPGEGFSR